MGRSGRWGGDRGGVEAVDDGRTDVGGRSARGIELSDEERFGDADGAAGGVCFPAPPVTADEAVGEVSVGEELLAAAEARHLPVDVLEVGGRVVMLGDRRGHRRQLEGSDGGGRGVAAAAERGEGARSTLVRDLTAAGTATEDIPSAVIDRFGTTPITAPPT